jgi:hypothetical protein
MLLSDGITKVGLGTVLTVAQLTGLMFQPTAGTFSTSSTFAYTVTDPSGLSASGTATLAIGADTLPPVTTDPTLTVAPNSGPTPIGIPAPTDPNYAASQLSVTVTGLPTDGTVLLSDGVTIVTAGARGTVAQLTGLMFKPTAGLAGQSSDFTYLVTNPAGLSAPGVETLAINASSPPPPAGNIVGFALQNNGTTVLAMHEITFNQVFAAGQVPSGSHLAAVINGVSYAAQVDAKTFYADGSIESALIALDAPSIAAGTTLQGQLVLTSASSAPAVDITQLPGSASYNLIVSLTLHNSDGTTTPYQLNAGALLGQALQASKVSYWMQGPQATEVRFDVPISGSFHVTFDVTDFADGTNRTDVQFNNDDAMQSVGGTVTYDQTITLNGITVSQYSNIGQFQYQTRHQVFWSNGAPQVNIQHDIAALEKTGAIQGYDLGYNLSLNQSGLTLASEATAMASSSWGGALPVNGVLQGMPTTGGRPDIGPTTGANALWLVTQDQTAAQYALGQADAAGSVPWHFFDPTTGNYTSVSQYPNLWTDPRGGSGPPGGLTQQVDPTNTGWQPDQAHQPDLSYDAYILTGDRYYLDQINAQADASILASWSWFRAQGGYTDIVANGWDQIRQQGWSLRQIDEASWANPDGSAEKAYFTQVAADNWSYLVSQLPTWTTMEGEGHGYIPYFQMSNNMEVSPWMEDYFASTVIAAAEQGNQNAVTVLDWMSNYLVGRFQAHTGWNTHDGAAYRNVVTDASGNYYQTWGAIETATQAGGFSNGIGWTGGDYAELALESLAGIITVLHSPAAIQAYGWLLASGAPQLQSDPQFQIAPKLPDGNFLYSNQVLVNTSTGGVTLTASTGIDSLLHGGPASSAILIGGTGSCDLLFGGTGDATLKAGTGNDYLFGGSATNSFVDNTGNNYMVGAGVANTFVFTENQSGRDTIANFNSSTDHLQVAANLNGNGITTAAGLIGAATVSNGNTVFHLSSQDDITLLGISTPTSLTSSILVL